MRRQFQLPEQDSDYLDACEHRWETVRDAQGNWLIIEGYAIPAGYTVSSANLALKIDNGYPVAQIDMVYFFPDLRKSTGGTIGALVMQVIDGRRWQRWSRHRTGENPWRPGLDDVSTHLQLVNFWLEREIK